MNASIYHIAIPMLQPFNHAKSDRHLSESIVFCLEHRGVIGLGECAPRIYVTGESISSVIDSIIQIDIESLINKIEFSTLDSAINSFNKIEIFSKKTRPQPLNAICAIEMAIMDLIGKLFNTSISEIIKRHYLPKNLVNIDNKSFITTQVMDFSQDTLDFLELRKPFHFIKIKLGKDYRYNLKRVKKVRESVGHSIPISVDANMSWSELEAQEMIKMLRPFGIAYYEEPLKKGSLLAYKKLREKHQAKILLDESVCSLDDAHQAIKNNACDALNIRISKCGGIINSIRLIELAVKKNLDFQIGAQVAETGPLIAAGRQLISAIEKYYFTYEAGQPDRFFERNNFIVDPMPCVNRSNNLAYGLIEPGLGVNPSKSIDSNVINKIIWDKSKRWQSITA